MWFIIINCIHAEIEPCLTIDHHVVTDPILQKKYHNYVLMCEKADVIKCLDIFSLFLWTIYYL